MRESRFEQDLCRQLEARFPGCVILKNDSSLIQGIPDRLILHGRNWAALEVKVGARAPRRPNQEYWVDMLDRMSFAAFVHPGNREEVLRDLQHAFESRR